LKLSIRKSVEIHQLPLKMNKKLYIGNISYNTSEEELEKAFSEAGNVESCDIITERGTGRSKGFGFVEMSTEEEAKKAIELLNGEKLDGRPLKVDEAKPRN